MFCWVPSEDAGSSEEDEGSGRRGERRRYDSASDTSDDERGREVSPLILHSLPGTRMRSVCSFMPLGTACEGLFRLLVKVCLCV